MKLYNSLHRELHSFDKMGDLFLLEFLVMPYYANPKFGDLAETPGADPRLDPFTALDT